VQYPDWEQHIRKEGGRSGAREIRGWVAAFLAGGMTFRLSELANASGLELAGMAAVLVLFVSLLATPVTSWELRLFGHRNECDVPRLDSAPDERALRSEWPPR
jgi:hypothetical protein